ncbi:hypothetical protein [Phaffia rhodozyma]|uniref:Mediator of RNA polymerase II transcription subunit 19 n=1 Tax=Phaffia rhodozyma TaxID=264483 RepID=A0A0F7SFT5_PHARH|nr:hypothetical protein [Phaffia rhodozyma]
MADQPVASSSRLPPVLIPFQPPDPGPPAHLTGSVDLLTHLSLRTSYDTFVRPYFRNPKPLVGQQLDEKGKSKESGLTARKEAVMDLKKMKDNYEDLVPECVVLGNHPIIQIPPSSFHRLVFESTDDQGNALPTQEIKKRSKAELEQAGWWLAPGDLEEAKDPALFVRQPRPEKRKKAKRPRPIDDIGLGPSSLNPLLSGDVPSPAHSHLSHGHGHGSGVSPGQGGSIKRRRDSTAPTPGGKTPSSSQSHPHSGSHPDGYGGSNKLHGSGNGKRTPVPVLNGPTPGSTNDDDGRTPGGGSGRTPGSFPADHQSNSSFQSYSRSYSNQYGR